MVTLTSSPPTDTLKPTSTLSRAKLPTHQLPHLFHNDGQGTFTDAIQKVGTDLATPMVGRGGAYGDIDNDGDWDLLITTSNVALRISSETTVVTKTLGLRFNSSERQAIATASARRSA